MKIPSLLIASFTGSGVLSEAPLLDLLEALERRGVLYHKAVPGFVDVAQERVLEDGPGEEGPDESWVRRISLQWRRFHDEPMLSQEGLEGFRSCLQELPRGLKGLRVQLGYAFPGQSSMPVQLICLMLDGKRWEVQLVFPAGPSLDPENPSRARANPLLIADLAEAIYDVLGPPYGALRYDAGVIQDQLPATGWGFLCANLVEQAGRGLVEAFATKCYKSWELADGGWFLAPSPLDSLDEPLEQERRLLLASARHLGLENMRGAGWKVH